MSTAERYWEWYELPAARSVQQPDSLGIAVVDLGSSLRLAVLHEGRNSGPALPLLVGPGEVRLIAAAPKLLAACKAALKHHLSMLGDGGPDGGPIEDPIVQAFSVAIFEATGKRA